MKIDEKVADMVTRHIARSMVSKDEAYREGTIRYRKALEYDSKKFIFDEFGAIVYEVSDNGEMKKYMDVREMTIHGDFRDEVSVDVDGSSFICHLMTGDDLIIDVEKKRVEKIERAQK